MKTLFKYTWPVVALCALAACADDDNAADNTIVDPHNGKELISLGGDDGRVTRAYPDLEAFESSTKIVLRIKAEKSGETDVRYTEAVAEAGGPATTCTTHSAYGMTAQHSHVNYKSTGNNYRYWDDAFGRKSLVTVYAVAVPNKSISDNKIDDNIFARTSNGTAQADASTTNTSWYTITGDEKKTVSWTVPTLQNSTNHYESILAYSNNIRSDASNENGDEKGRYHQQYESSDWTKSMEYGRLAWQSQNPSDDNVTTGKFDQGHLVFKHAVSWITLVLKEGEGFNHSIATDFAWTSKPTGTAQTITLTGFPTTGTLDVSKKLTETDLWSTNTPTEITQLWEATIVDGGGLPTNAETTRTLHAIVLPGTDLYNTGTGNYGDVNVIAFEIDDAKYYVKGSQIAQAIRDYNYGTTESPNKKYSTFTKIEPGKHYYINLTVGKKQIDNVTAAILPWEEVSSEDAVAKNTYATFTFEERETKLGNGDASKFDIYRASPGEATSFIDGTTTPNYQWKTGYEGPATKNYVANTAIAPEDNSHWSTQWYWYNNKTYYHFRAAGTGDSQTTSPTILTDGTGENSVDYFAIGSGAIQEPYTGSPTTNYRDYVWGAPFNYVDNSYKIIYTPENGFDQTQTLTIGGTEKTFKQLSPAIGATDSKIDMLLFHMTSKITVNVQTTTDDDKVVLYVGPENSDPEKKTKVEILNFLPDGRVLMGTGAVKTNPLEAEATSSQRTSEDMTPGTYTAQTGSGTTENPYVAAHVDGYSYGVVPQKLTWTGDNAGTIGLRITTPDGNQYLVKDLSTCLGTVTTTHLYNSYTKDGDKYKITEWLPHYKYTYTITIKKTGIQNITAAVLPWEEVTGDLGTIDLEN